MKSIFIICMLFSIGSLYAQECWSEEELTEYSLAEVEEDTIVFSVKDALSCAPLIRAEVEFGNMSLHTDMNGEFRISMLTLDNIKKIRFIVKKSKYITLDSELKVQHGTIEDNKILLTPKSDKE